MTGTTLRDLPWFTAQLDDTVLRQYVADVAEDASSRPERAMATLRQASERLLRQLVDALRERAVDADARLLSELAPKLERGQFTTTLEKLRDRALLSAGIALRFSQLWAWGSPAHHDQRSSLGFTQTDVERQLGPLIDLIDHLRACRGAIALAPPAAEIASLPSSTPTWLATFLAAARTEAHAPRDGRLELHRLAATIVWTPGDASELPAGHRFEAYDIDDAAWFFGRDPLCERIHDRVTSAGHALLSGASGSGKSSLLRAGVIPRLVDAGVPVVYVGDYRPGLVPLLDAISARPGGEIVLVVDQLDHLFVPGVDVGHRAAVLEALGRAAVAPGTTLIGGVREDFLGALLRVLEADHRALTETLDPRRALIPVAPLAEHDAIEILARHLARAGHAPDRSTLATVIEPLVDREEAIASVSPFVVQALLGEVSRGGKLEASTTTGGVEAALRWHVDDALRSLPGDRRDLARVLIKAMGTSIGRTWVDVFTLAALGEIQLVYDDVERLPGERSAADVIESVLTALIERRFVIERRVGASGARELTLAHDRLGVVVNAWRSPEELERAQAQEELDRAVREHAAGRREALSAGRLTRVEKHWRALRKDEGGDEVLRRSRRARTRIRAAFATLAAIALVALGFGVWQYRRVAAERANVEARRAESEQLLSFLLYDLRARLERVGRVDMLEDVVQRAIAHFDRWPADHSDVTSRGRIAARCYLGQIRRAQGDLTAARAAYADGLARFAGDPRRDLPSWRELYVDCLEADADALMFSGDLPAALAQYQRLLELARGWLAERPDDRAAQGMVASGLGSVGEVLQKEGKLDEALASFEEALAIRERIAAAAPDDQTVQFRLSRSLYKVGEVLLRRGDASGALDHASRAHEIRERLLARSPGDQELQRGLVATLVRTGDALLATGDIDTALERFTRCTAIQRALVDRDPDNVYFYLRDLTVCRQREAEARHAAHDLAGAEAAYREILPIRERLAAKDPGDGDWQYELAEVHHGLGLVLRDHADPGAAVELSAANDLLVALTARAPWNARWNELRDLTADALAALPRRAQNE